MLPTRKGKPKQEKSVKKPSISIFEFLNDITVDKVNILNSDNDHAYSKFMITRFLSMYEPYLPIADLYLNKYQFVLTNDQFHKFCIAIIPQKKVYFNFMKTAPVKNECKDKLKVISDYFKVSAEQAYEYYDIAGDDLVTNIQLLYGIVEEAG